MVPGAVDIRTQCRLHRRQGLAHQRFGRQTIRLESRVHPFVAPHGRFGAEDEQHAFPLVFGLDGPALNELFEEPRRAFQDGGARPHGMRQEIGAAHAGEPQQPGDAGGIERRLDVKRRTPPQHAEYLLAHRAGHAQRHNVAHEHQPAVAVGRPRPDGALLQDAHPAARLGQVMGAGQSDHPASNNQHFAVTPTRHFYSSPSATTFRAAPGRRCTGRRCN